MTPPVVEVFWSFRSPFCYLTLDRLTALKARGADVRVRPVYPMAVRDPNFFKSVNPKYRTYHTQDFQRMGDYLGMPIRRPVPDPIVMDMETNGIARDQPHIHLVTRLGALAQRADRDFAFVDHVMRVMWDGGTDNWDRTEVLANSLAVAGLDGTPLIDEALNRPEAADGIIEDNQAAMDQADHWGLPLMLFDGETFYGQDRVDLLAWRMEQKGALPPV